MSLVLAAGITVTPVTAADFTDGTVSEFNSDDATEFDVQQETADNAEFASDTEDSISDKAGSNEADSDEEVFAEAVIPDENGAVDNRQLLEKYLNDILYGQDPALAVLTAYEQLLAICSLFDCAPRASSKEADWIQQAAHVFAPYGVTQEELTLLAEQAQIAQFSAEPPTAAQQKQAVRTLKAIFKKLYAKASRWKRFQLKYRTHIL